MRRGPEPRSRMAVQHAIEAAGTAGITGEELEQLLPGMTLNHIKAQVYRLRSEHGMPLVSRRSFGGSARYWAHADLMPPPSARPVPVKAPPAPKPPREAKPEPVREATFTQRITDWLVSNPAGGVAETVAESLGFPKGMVSSLLSQIRQDGHAVSRPAPQGKAARRLHYYAPQHAPAFKPLPVLTKPANRKPGRLVSLAPAGFATAEADYSRAVVTVCPAGVDHRFTFTPGPGWCGTITRDWQERRLQEQQHGR